MNVSAEYKEGMPYEKSDAGKKEDTAGCGAPETSMRLS
jgi:hypothetical protein